MDRRMAILGAASAGIALAGTASAAPEDVGRKLMDRFTATLTAHDIKGFADLFADDYVNHQLSAAAPPPAAGMTNKQATVAFFAARLTGIPDLKVTIEALIAAGDQVAASLVNTGTHGGVFFGVPPTGRALRFTSCDIFRVADGRFVEHWGMGDIAGVLAQLRA